MKRQVGVVCFNITVVEIRIWIPLTIQESNCTSNSRGTVRGILFPFGCLGEGASLSEVDPRDKFPRTLNFGSLQVRKFPGSK